MIDISPIDVLLVASGTLAVLVSVLSRRFRSLPVSEPLVALSVGVLLGPQVTAALDVPSLTEESKHLHEAARVLLALSVMAVALRYPSDAVRRRWRSVGLLLVVVMPLMALTTVALSTTILGMGLGAAALLGMALAPTDPVLAAGVVTGRPAEDTLPARDREMLSLESGANDGLAFPLVIAALAFATPLGTEAAALEIVYAVGGALALGCAIGWLGAQALTYAEKHNENESTPTTLLTVFLALAALGASGLLGLDGVFTAFAAGVTFNLSGAGEERARNSGLNELMTRITALPLFVYFGAVLPWSEWAPLGWPGLALAVAVLLLRRLPWLWLLARPLRLGRVDAAYLGWFGPIGVSAIFYLTLLAERGAATPQLLAAGSLVVAVSLAAHGVTSASGVNAYRRLTSHT